MERLKKLMKLSAELQSLVDEFKYSEEKPVYYWNWVKRLIYIKIQIMRFSKK